MVEILIVTLIIILIVQTITFIKVIRIVSQVSKLLFEVRILFKNSGIFYLQEQKRVSKSTTCQYCRHRLSFIQIVEESGKDSFYYVCKKSEKEVSLSDTCQLFDRDFQAT